MRKNDLVALFVLGITGSRYLEPYMRVDQIGALTMYMESNTMRPFVFRVLVPLSTRGFAWLTEVPVNVAFALVWFGFAVSFYAALVYLMGEVAWAQASLAFMVFMVLFIRNAKPYDIPTAAFFALGLGLMQHGRLKAFYWMYPLACLNRETTFLLTLVYAIHFWGRLNWRDYVWGLALQALTFAAVYGGLTWYFRGMPGSGFMWRPLENLRLFAADPMRTAIHALGFGVAIWLSLRGWDRKPPLLRTAFVTLMPTLMVLYLCLGWSFEIRVFAEVYPVVVGLAFSGQW